MKHSAVSKQSTISVYFFLILCPLYPGSRDLKQRERDSKRKTPKRTEGPLASAVDNLTSMFVAGSDFELSKPIRDKVQNLNLIRTWK